MLGAPFSWLMLPKTPRNAARSRLPLRRKKINRPQVWRGGTRSGTFESRHSGGKRNVEMNRCNLLVATIALTFVAGCASVDTQTADSRDGGIVVTGSRIPVRDGNTSSDVKTTKNKEAIDDMMQRGRIHIPAKGGGI